MIGKPEDLPGIDQVLVNLVTPADTRIVASDSGWHKVAGRDLIYNARQTNLTTQPPPPCSAGPTHHLTGLLTIATSSPTHGMIGKPEDLPGIDQVLVNLATPTRNERATEHSHPADNREQKHSPAV